MRFLKRFLKIYLKNARRLSFEQSWKIFCQIYLGECMQQVSNSLRQHFNKFLVWYRKLCMGAVSFCVHTLFRGTHYTCSNLICKPYYFHIILRWLCWSTQFSISCFWSSYKSVHFSFVGSVQFCSLNFFLSLKKSILRDHKYSYHCYSYDGFLKRVMDVGCQNDGSQG